MSNNERTERASAPVGTTVRTTDFFKHLPVRKQNALKHSGKWLAKIRRLMQAYALARPSVRFNLRVLKAKSNKGDFVYAPKKDANVEDVVFKVIGKDCALQCDWTAIESDGFEVQAFLPKPNAIGSKIGNEGAFISIDGRPVSTGRGILKKIVTTFKERLRKSNPKLVSIKEPFICMNIICPPESYDPNIEPAKDDVLFEEGDLVVAAVDKLLVSYYPEATIEVEEVEEEAEEPKFVPRLSKRSETPVPIHQDSRPSDDISYPPESSKSQPQWRSSMYGIDEEDLEFLNDEQAQVIEEEEGRRAASISNPWTIAMMNSRTRKPTSNGQLMTPAKGRGDINLGLSSSSPAVTPRQQTSVEPLTPQTLSRTNIVRPVVDEQLQDNLQQLPLPPVQPLSSNNVPSEQMRSDIVTTPGSRPHSGSLQEAVAYSQAPFPPSTTSRPHRDAFGSFTSARNVPDMPLDMVSSSPAPRRTQHRKSRTDYNPPEAEQPDDWFGQSMHGQPSKAKQPRQQKSKRTRNPQVPSFPQDDQENFTGRLHSNNNRDIRQFIGQGRTRRQASASVEPLPGLSSSFTPINGRSQEFPGRLTLAPGKGVGSFPQLSQRVAPHEPFSRASSVEVPNRAKDARDRTLINPHRASSLEPSDIADQLRLYVERDNRLRPSSAESFLGPPPGPQSSLMPYGRSKDNEGALHVHNPTDSSSPHKLCAYKDLGDQAQLRQPAPPQPHPHTAPSQERFPVRPASRRTTDGTRRRRLSRLPLERVPQIYRIHNLQIRLNINTSGFANHMRKIDMGVPAGNSLEWGFPATESSYDIFGSTIIDATVKFWTGNVVKALDRMFERENGVEVEVEIMEGIRKLLRERREEDERRDARERMDAWTQDVTNSSIPTSSLKSSAAAGLQYQESESTNAIPASGAREYASDYEFEYGEDIDDIDMSGTKSNPHTQEPPKPTTTVGTLDLHNIPTLNPTPHSNEVDFSAFVNDTDFICGTSDRDRDRDRQQQRHEAPPPVQNSDEFGDGIEDDMLLDF
jgi:DNA mismatch repair ATPase MutL